MFDRGEAHHKVKEHAREVELKGCCAASCTRKVQMVAILHLWAHMIGPRAQLDACTMQCAPPPLLCYERHNNYGAASSVI